MKVHYWALMAGLFLLLSGCARQVVEAPGSRSSLPTPTIHPFFAAPEDFHITGGVESIFAAPAAADPYNQRNTPTPTVSAAGGPSTPTPAAASPEIETTTITLFDESVHADWEIIDIQSMDVEMTSTQALRGRTALALTPTDEFQQFFMVVRKNARSIYPRDRVLGLSLWINSGDEALYPEDLALTVVGSNRYPYWLAGDRSVAGDDENIFSETRLYFLGINTEIPPQTWVEVQVWLDDLLYDPDYEYVTGFYIKNDSLFQRTFYVDRIELILLDEEKPEGLLPGAGQDAAPVQPSETPDPLLEEYLRRLSPGW